MKKCGRTILRLAGSALALTVCHGSRELDVFAAQVTDGVSRGGVRR